jgi:hypothetical protein
MVVIAHVAHWSSLIFFAPVIGFIAWLVVAQLRERRGRRAGASDPRSGR